MRARFGFREKAKREGKEGYIRQDIHWNRREDGRFNLKSRSGQLVHQFKPQAPMVNAGASKDIMCSERR
jgi:hypothetical protein